MVWSCFAHVTAPYGVETGVRVLRRGPEEAGPSGTKFGTFFALGPVLGASWAFLARLVAFFAFFNFVFTFWLDFSSIWGRFWNDFRMIFGVFCKYGDLVKNNKNH